MTEIPRIAISIRQPWTSLIIYDGKDIENRSRRHSYRGPVALHASLAIEQNVVDDLEEGLHPVTGEEFYSEACRLRQHLRVGGIVGVAEVVDCVTDSDSDWFVGPYGFVIRNARPVDFIPCSGALGFFDWRETERKAQERRAAKEAVAA